MSLLPVPGLSFADQATLDELTNQLESKNPRNKVRSDYYDQRNLFKDLGISTPPKFRNFDAVLGWPAKAVDSMSRRCKLDGFTIPGLSAEDLGIDVVWSDNAMDVEAPQAHDSALIHSCAFVTTIKGDTASGEPEVLMMVRDAFNATGLWSPRKRGFTAGLSVIERDGASGLPKYLVLYLPDKVLILNRAQIGGRWTIDTRPNPLGRVPMEPLVYKPRLGRPFGRSRINRAVMYITDSAIRTVVRSEIGAEFYTAPQRYGLNIPQDVFESSSGWKAIQGRFLMMPPPDPDEEIDPNFAPQLGQFPQISMQPHTDQIRQWAMLFAGETNLPVSSLGIIQDNPASAEALYAAKEELVIECEAATAGFGMGWERAMRNALMVRDNLSEIPDEFRKIRANWRDPATPSRASIADAVTKEVATFPWMADSEVTLERAGYTRAQIDRLMADKRRSTANSLVAALSQRPPAPAISAPRTSEVPAQQVPAPPEPEQ